MRYNQKDHQLNSFLTTHLLTCNGFLVSDDVNTYTTNFCTLNNTPHKITLRKQPSSDLAVYTQVFIAKEYQPLVDLVRKYAGSSKLGKLNIIDAGGNIGATSIFLNMRFPDSNFIIIEPDINNFKILQKNIEQNNIENSTLVLGGVWNKDTFLEIRRDFRDRNDWGIRVVESPEPNGLKGFSLLTLMQLRNFDYIDILKIDIEGSEKQLFADHAAAAMFLSRTKYIAMEIHDEFNCRNDVIECLKENKFEFFNSGETLFGVNKQMAP